MTIPKVGENPLVEGLREMGLQPTSPNQAGYRTAPGTAEEASRDGVDAWSACNGLKTRDDRRK